MRKYTNEQLDYLRKFLPGLGCFGGKDVARRWVQINDKIDGFTICINEDHPQFFNMLLPHIELDCGRVLGPKDYLAEYTITTSYPTFKQATVKIDNFRDDMIHSSLELRPTLTVKLVKDLNVKGILLINRNDKYGTRSRFAELRTYNQGNEVSFFSAASNDELMKSYEALRYSLGVRESRSFNAELLMVKKALSRCLITGVTRLSFLQICELLPIYDSVQNLSEYDLMLVRLSVLKLMDGRSSAPTAALGVMANILSTRERMDKISEILNKTEPYGIFDFVSIFLKKLKSYTDPELVISKHEINFSEISQHSKDYISAAKKVIQTLEDSGIKAVICYGTLLGGVREGAVMKHDDDIDVLYYDGSTSSEEMYASRAKVIDLLRSAHIPSKNLGDCANFHVEYDGRDVDLFPCWIDGDHLHVMMERGNYRPIPKDIVFGKKNLISINGEKLPCPHDSIAFLVERYGDSWHTEDKYHEWPWQVD